MLGYPYFWKHPYRISFDVKTLSSRKDTYLLKDFDSDVEAWRFGDRCWNGEFPGHNSKVHMGVSLNNGTPHFTPQNDHF